jgi:hypothetical protein
MKIPPTLLVIALAGAAAACGEQSAVEPGTATAGAAPARGLDATPTAKRAEGPIAPAIIPPDEVADPAEPPSYEVAIASAAAQRNTALRRCAAQPEAVRAQCEQEANAAFAEAESDLQNLRGNTP